MSKNDSDREVFEQYAELVKRFKAGDESAFTEIYEKSKRLVYATCYGILNNKEDAEDAMQETYINLYNKIGTLEDDKSFLEWLKRMASNKALDKRKSIKDESSFDEVVEGKDYSDEDIDLEHLPESLIMEKDKRDTFYKIMRNELSDAQFQTIFLHYYDELPLVDIADLMNCSIETVRSRLKSARAKLKSGIQEYEKTNKVSLLGAAGTGTLGKFFGSYYGSLKVPAVKNFPVKIASVSKSSSAVKAAAGKSAGSAAKRAGGITRPKVLGIAGAAAVVVTAGVLVVNLLNKQDRHVQDSEITEDSEVVTESVLTETSETVMTETSAPSTKVKRDVTVSDAVNEMRETAVSHGPFYSLYRLPEVEMSGLDMSSVNEKIISDVEALGDKRHSRELVEIDEYGTIGFGDYLFEIGADYVSYVDDEVVSLCIKVYYDEMIDSSIGYEYLVYNISVETGELMSPADFIAECGMTDDEFSALAGTKNVIPFRSPDGNICYVENYRTADEDSLEMWNVYDAETHESIDGMFSHDIFPHYE
jgi:RNA polymerase sigma factor (sigma-70 family)